EESLADTIEHLENAGVAVVGAGLDETSARAGTVIEAHGVRIGVLGLADHPGEFAAGPGRPGVAYADLSSGVPAWVKERIAALRARTDVVLVTPHWGPNMVAEPLPYIRRAAAELLESGATLIAGHSAHVFQ